MDEGVPRRRRARPVADAPVDALLTRAESITKGWLVALLEQTPLEGAAAILAADLVRDGPRVCDAVIRALASDADLRRLEPGGALEQLVARTAELPGVASPAAASAAIDALHGVLWSAVRDELHHPEPEQVSELAQRLALVIESVRDAALRRLAGPAGETGRLLGAIDARERMREPEAPPPAVEEVREPGISAVPNPSEAAPRAADALWIGALEEEIARSERSGAPLSLLLVELEDGERVRAVEPASLATATLGRFAQAVRDTVRRPDIIASESDTRAWVIARETGRSGAQALASRLGQAVRAAEPWRGAPMTVSIGVGVLGEDGRDVDSLIEAAEESRFAAAASGVEVVRAGGEDDRAGLEGQAPPGEGGAS